MICEIDIKWMVQALELAQKAWGMTAPNPMVGCVVVKSNTLVGRGYHHKAGEAHAEVNALRDAGDAARDAVAYVTLEPCSTTGRTGPCTQSLIDAGISRVVIGSLDPNPDHAGRGVAILEDAGIEVSIGVLEDRCLELNEAFFKWISEKKPFVLLKMAMTLDGKIATKEGQSQWITGADARGRVQHLRQWSDAIVVGGETVRRDKPSLTVRNVDDWPCQPKRVVVSRSLSVDDAVELMAEGNEPMVFAPSNNSEWDEMLLELGSQDVMGVLIEGGGELAASALEAGVVDKVEFHIAPKILGGRGSRTVIGGTNPSNLSEALGLERVKTFSLGCDFAFTGYVSK